MFQNWHKSTEELAFSSLSLSVLKVSFSLSQLLQGKIVAQGRLLLQDTFMVSDQDGGLLSRMKERRVFLFEQIVIFSEPIDKKKGFSTPGYLFKNSIKVSAAQQCHKATIGV